MESVWFDVNNEQEEEPKKIQEESFCLKQRRGELKRKVDFVTLTPSWRSSGWGLRSPIAFPSSFYFSCSSHLDYYHHSNVQLNLDQMEVNVLQCELIVLSVTKTQSLLLLLPLPLPLLTRSRSRIQMEMWITNNPIQSCYLIHHPQIQSSQSWKRLEMLINPIIRINRINNKELPLPLLRHLLLILHRMDLLWLELTRARELKPGIRVARAMWVSTW